MYIRDKVELILDMLQKHGGTGSSYSLAQMMGVHPSTVLRWKSGDSEPRGRQKTTFDLLYRIAYRVSQDDPTAKDIWLKLIEAPSLVTYGIGGILMTLGLGWLLNDQPE